MIKKKAKKKAAAKKTKKSSTRAKKPMNPAEVRKDIARLVGSGAKKMAQAVIAEGKRGQLATVKYLFEVAEIFPPPTDGSQATSEEDSLAQTLLRRLDLPDEPIVRDENGEIVKVSPVKAAEEIASSSGEKEPDEKADAPEERKDPVLA